MLSSREDALCLIVLGLLSVASIQAGANRWTVRHPADASGSVLGLAADPQQPGTVYLASQNGFFRSRDYGIQWSKVNPVSLGRQVRAAVSMGSTTLYALGGNGVILSQDGGATWFGPGQTRYWFLPTPTDALLAVDVAQEANIYVSTVCCVSTPNDIPTEFLTWRSDDSGEEFVEITDQVGFALSVAIDRQIPKTLYMASRFLGVFRSQDGGQSWTPVAAAGLPQGDEVLSLEVDPQSNPALLLAGLESGQIFASSDRGENWSEAGQIPHRVGRLAVDTTANPSIYYASSRAGVHANFDRDSSQWLPLRQLSLSDSINFLALAATAQGNPSALFAVINNRLEHFQPQYRYLPQVGDGQSGDLRLQTSFLASNTGGESFFHLEFFDSSGQVLPLDLVDQGSQSSISLTLERGQTLTLEGVAGPGLRTGYARLLADAAVGGTAIFTRSDVPSGLVFYEAGVPLAGALTDFTIAVDTLGSREPGLALVNATSETAHLTLRLYDESFQLIAEEEADLAPGQHLARFIFELFPAAGAEIREMKGALTVESDQPLAAVTLRQTEDPAATFPDFIPTLTAFPVVPGRADQNP